MNNNQFFIIVDCSPVKHNLLLQITYSATDAGLTLGGRISAFSIAWERLTDENPGKHLSLDDRLELLSPRWAYEVVPAGTVYS